MCHTLESKISFVSRSRCYTNTVKVYIKKNAQSNCTLRDCGFKRAGEVVIAQI